MPTTFGLLLFDGVEELDFVGPWEVFTASSMLRENTGQPADTIITISEHDRPVRCSKGLRVLADHTSRTIPRSMSSSPPVASAPALKSTIRY